MRKKYNIKKINCLTMKHIYNDISSLQILVIDYAKKFRPEIIHEEHLVSSFRGHL